VALGYPITRYDFSHRCKCEALRALQSQLRDAIDDGLSSDEMRDLVRRALPASQVITFEECVAQYELADTVLVSTHANGDEYTAVLIPLKGNRKYRIGKHAPLPNGRIVIAATPPCAQAVETYASTIHGFQGRDVVAPARLFIDSRRMFCKEHWYVAVTRPEYLSQIYLVCPDASPLLVPRWGQTKMYVIRSLNTPLVYVGYTTGTLPIRMAQHQRGAMNTKRRCTSHKVLEEGDARIELLEDWPCSSRQEAMEREQWWIHRFGVLAVNL